MRRIAVTIAAASFFVLAGVSWVSGLDVFDCAIRAGVGAAVVYALAATAIQVTLSVMVDAVVKNKDKRAGS